MSIKENRERITGDEKYYTNDDIVDMCVRECLSYLKPSHTIIDPAAGDGAFLRGFERAKISNLVLMYDIAPAKSFKGIIKQDFLKFDLSSLEPKLFAITNPPFGRANKLNVRFFNHLATHSQYIGFIVPISWRKWSIENRLHRNFWLVKDFDLPMNCFHKPDGTPLNTGILHTVFQIWEKRPEEKPRVVVEDRGYFKKSVPRDADVAFTGFGYKTGTVETDFKRVPNTCKLFLKLNPLKKKEIIRAMKSIDVTRFTKNSAYTGVCSMMELRFLLNEYFDNSRG
jgi:hypothetical protein